MKISIGADERLPVVDHAIRWLQHYGHEIEWHGPESGAALPWPQVARQVAEDVAAGAGVGRPANKVPGPRAALCADAETARGARLWNNANILCLSLRRTTPALAEEILERWFNTQYRPNPTDDANLEQIEDIDRSRAAS